MVTVHGEVKFIYSEKATKFWEIFTLLLSYAVPFKSKAKISQNFVAFSEYMNFTTVGAVQLSQEKRIVINNLPLLISQLLKYHECHVNNFYGVYYIADLACPDMLSCVAMVTTRTF